MDTKLSQQTSRELLEVLCGRYQNASKIEKTKILDEFINIAHCHRKHAIRFLTGIDLAMPYALRGYPVTGNLCNLLLSQEFLRTSRQQDMPSCVRPTRPI